MDKVKRALLGDRKAQAELTKKGRKQPCHVCGKTERVCQWQGERRMFWKKLKQRFCKHKWVEINVVVVNRGLVEKYFQCHKCGKIQK